MKIGIVGLPNVGKSTLFQALTKKVVDIADYPFTTIKPNIGVLPVPDERFEKIVALIKPLEHFPAVIEVVDIAGLIEGAHKGEGLGNEFLSHIYEVDAILFLLRLFDEKDDPKKALEILRNELAQKDNALAKKPSIVVCNVRSENGERTWEGCDIHIDAKLELEMDDISPEERRELSLSSRLPQPIQLAYKTLNLITFYTIKGGKEARAWAIPQGTKAPEAGGRVHTDFENNFIRAEVISTEKLLKAGGWHPARDRGWLRTEGKEYVVQDGDVVEFRI